MNSESTKNQNRVISIGDRLRIAREQLRLTQEAVADRLCLKVSTIRDLEEDRVPTNLGLTFLRGYICSYAKLVHIPEDELLPMIEKQVLIQPVKIATIQSFSLGRHHKKHELWFMPFTCLVLFVVIGLTGIWWWQNHKVQQEEIALIAEQSSNELSSTVDHTMQNAPLHSYNTPVVTKQSQTAPKNTFQTVQSASSLRSNSTPMQAIKKNNGVFSVSSANIDTTPTIAENANITQQSLQSDQVSVTASSDQNALTINFTADCWLEVTDITGKKLFSGLKHKNDKLRLIGQTPYKLKIGAPAMVKIQFKGKPIDLSRFIGANQIARFTVNTE